MSNLIISSKINKTLPKPTKAQLIEALLIKVKELHKKEEKNKIKLREGFEKQLLEAGLKELKKADVNKFQLCVNIYQESANIEFNLATAECKKLIRKIADNKAQHYYEDEAKKKIINSLKPHNPLLGNSQVEKSLEDLALQIFSNVKTIEA
jgi:hypothetical protein